MKEDWIECRLNNVGIIYSGGTPKTKNIEYWGDEVAWISPADLSKYNKKYISKGNKSITYLGLSKSSAKLIPKGSVLFSSRAPIGYVVIAENDLATNQGFKSIYPSSGVFNEYIYFYLKASKHIAERNASGTTFREISKSAFGELPFPLAPLPIQRAIVSKIETLFSDLDNGIADLKKAQEQLKIYRQSVLKKAFEGGLTSDSSNRELIKLGSIIEKPNYGTSKKCSEKVQGIPVLRIPNIGSGFVDTKELKYAEFEESEISKLALKEGDILTIRSNGSVNLVGKCALITKRDTQYLYAGYLIRLRPDLKRIDSNYLLYCLSSHDLRIQIENKAKSTSGVNNINSGELQGLEIPIFPIKKQHQIVREIESRLSVCDKVEQNITEALNKSEALRQSILKKAFEGKLLSQAEIAQCKQEADYEPASMLLERINKEKNK